MGGWVDGKVCSVCVCDDAARHHVHRDDGGGGLGVGMGVGLGGRHTSDTVYGSEHEAYD